MLMFGLQFVVCASGVAAFVVSAALAFRMARKRTGGLLWRAVVTELACKSIAALATLAFIWQSFENMLTGVDPAGWNQISALPATFLRLAIFLPSLASSLYLTSRLSHQDDQARELQTKITAALQKPARNVESSF